MRFVAFLLYLFLLAPLCFWAIDSNTIAEKRNLQVAVYDSEPFGMLENGRVKGIMVEVWERVADKLGYEYEFEVVADMEQLIDGLKTNHYDVGIGAITITPAREEEIDFSHAIIASGTGVATGTESVKGAWRRKYRPILASLLELVGILALVMFVMGTIIWLIERKHKNLGFRDDFQGLGDGFWWAAVTMSTVGYGDKVPKTGWGKILTVVYIFISVVAVALFTANASSILTTAEIQSHIKEEDDLRRVHVGSVPHSSGAEYLERNLIAYKSFTSLDEAIDALRNEEVEAVVYNMPTLRFLQHNGQKDLVISNDYLQKNYMGFALPPESEHQEEINCILLELLGEAEWRQTVKRYLGRE